MRMLALLLTLCLTQPAEAGDRPDSACRALAETPARVQPARFAPPVDEGALLIRYLGHASFALVTDQGVLAVTDYTGSTGLNGAVPDVVTMNNAHSSHFTDAPDPGIAHVLRGWGAMGPPPDLWLDLGSLAVRNVTTDLRGPFGEGARKDGNSVFLFEAAGLCIVHLSHLHQVPNAAQLAAIGRVDVVMVPVDGAFTMDTATMASVVKAMRPRIVLPMHWFSAEGLSAFLAAMAPQYPAELRPGPDLILSRKTLPKAGTVIVLTPP